MSAADQTPVNHSPLTLEQKTEGDLRTLTVTGELDLMTHERFCRFLTDEAERDTRASLRLDLSGVDYMDARTWFLIVQTRRQLLGRGRPLSVSLASRRQPERVYRMLDLDRVIPRS